MSHPSADVPRVVTLVPARGGSKGVPGKNLRPVAGRPLIEWTLRVAQASRLASLVYVTTDAAAIADVATAMGVPVIDRPARLAQDESPMGPTLAHAVREVERRHGHPFDVVVLLQPTAPLRLAEDVDDTVRALLEGDGDSAMTVYRVIDAHPARMYRLEGGRLRSYSPEPSSALRQALPAVYHRNGAVYACRRDLLLDRERVWGDHVIPVVMPKERSINIDDEQDLVIADHLLRLRQGSA